MKAKRFAAVFAALALVLSAGFAVGCNEEKTYHVGDYVQMHRHELDNEDSGKTVKYLYIDPLGDVRELQSDTLYFVAEYPGDYTLRYLVYDRGFEIEMTDTVVTVLPAEGN